MISKQDLSNYNIEYSILLQYLEYSLDTYYNLFLASTLYSLPYI